MKRIIIVLLFLSHMAFGQSTGKQFLGLSIGASVPLGDFSESVIDDSTSGFAKTGLALTFNYAYRVAHNFGFQLIINYSSNSFNVSTYKSELEAAHPDYGVSVQSTNNWTSGGIFLGPYLRFPITRNLSWDIRALGGYFGSYSPSAKVNATNKNDLNDKKEHILQRSKANGFGYILGTGFKYQLGNYYVLLFGDYASSSLKFKDVVGWDWDGEPYSTSFNQKIDYITITGGVGYIL